MHHHHLLILLLTTLLLLTRRTSANVEKTIFLGPAPSLIPTLTPPIDDLGLPRLSPSYFHHRTKLNASFPSPDSAGTDSWFFLEHLIPGKRYEVRICWLATQPTSFHLTTYTLPHALGTPDLLGAITTYSTARLAHQQHLDDNGLALLSDLDKQVRYSQKKKPASPKGRHSGGIGMLSPNSRFTTASSSPVEDTAPVADSVLFLRVRAAADYYSTDPELMETVPPVVVDVILDPYLGNVFPRSLVPTAGWVVVVAGVAVFVGRWVVAELGRVVDSIASEEQEQEQEGEIGGEREAKKIQ
ncbi:uncharacterized protein BO95DRAFT_438111 [Aspergillus brunneoviolaceus CBS 621.78]|uniref:Uncharacterized protein n=1 Tax=Aspergillus brunneoviolaceus CBS 621.78 TaxID=1450534 RepID=A0ACD1GNS3_9EURO|nr:hypothetical protein BO95DRAFT_438111 [Aspergillus brunneoviolaceus CBS 621.78]RAH50852.1 hypothetical protein BO95DRAFT_438111 [Aspergillus brunneoviolaceus CBS 621.78]